MPSNVHSQQVNDTLVIGEHNLHQMFSFIVPNHTSLLAIGSQFIRQWDNALQTDTFSTFVWDGTQWVESDISTSLTSAHILVGNASNIATDVAVSGDLTLANTGAFTVNKIGGVTISLSPTTSGNVLVANGTVFNSVTMSGQILIDGTGATVADKGTGNTHLGKNAGGNVVANANCTYVGDSAGLSGTGGLGNTCIGQAAGQSLTSGAIGDTYVGWQAGMNTTSGGENTFIGVHAGKGNTGGSSNTFLGETAGAGNLNGNDNVFIGALAGQNADTSENVMIGFNAGNLTTSGGFNVFIGTSVAGANTSGSDDVYIGTQAGLNGTTAQFCVGVGSEALYSNVTGNNNTAVGYHAGYGLLGGGNVCIGFQAGQGETGSNKLYIANSSTSTPLIGGDFSVPSVTINGVLDMATHLIHNVVDPVSAQDAATKNYVDAHSGPGTLTSAHIFVGNGSNVATDVAASGDVTLTNTGAFTVTKINGVALGTTTATSGNLLVADGTDWDSVAASGDLTLASSGAFTIANAAVTNAKMANMATKTIKGNNTGGSAAPLDLTVAQVQAMLSIGQVEIWVDTPNGHGSTGTATRTFSHTQVNAGGSDLTYNSDATNGDNITVNTAGLYSVDYFDLCNVGGEPMGVTVNGNTSTSIHLQTTSGHVLGINLIDLAGGQASVGCVHYFSVNDVIRAQDNKRCNGTDAFYGLRVCRIF